MVSDLIVQGLLKEVGFQEDERINTRWKNKRIRQKKDRDMK